MAYRRNSESALRWRKWLRKNQSELEKCGLPEAVTADEDHWFDFLDHGFLDHHEDQSRFKVDHLSKPQIQALYDFLKTELSEEERELTVVLSQLTSMLNPQKA